MSGSKSRELKPAFEGVRPSTTREIEETEKITGKLPHSLKEYLLKFGEFSFRGSAKIPETAAGPLSILVFFGTHGDDSIVDYYRDFDELTSQGLVPIARNELGDIFAVERDDESVWFADYTYDDGLTRIANSFDAFMDMVEVRND